LGTVELRTEEEEEEKILEETRKDMDTEIVKDSVDQ
jgi:hypothetical protein